MNDCRSEERTHGAHRGGQIVITELRDFLVRGGAPFTVTAAQPTSAAGGRLARVMILRDGDAYMLAVLPAAAALDLAGFRRRSGRYGLTLAKEHEFRAEFPEFAAGPLPPFGRMVAMPVYLDRALADEAVMRFEGDADREVVSLPMREYVRVERPAIAPLTQALRAA
jgi:Ala-tRNA(Pro) deacylase